MAPLVHVPDLDRMNLLLQTLDPIARDGRAFVEVQLDLQKALTRLARHRDTALAEAARAVSDRALEYARIGLPIESDFRRVADVAPTSNPSN